MPLLFVISRISLSQLIGLLWLEMLSVLSFNP